MSEQVISIASYNIHSCRGRDGRCDPERIAGVMREIDSALLGLQEVRFRSTGDIDTSHLHYLAGSMQADFISGPTVTREDYHYGNALVTRFPIVEVKQLDLSYRRREPRSAIDVIIDVFGTRVQVIVTHLGLRSAERYYQVRKLTERLNQEYPTILLGDINEWLPLARPLWWMRQHFGPFESLKTFPSRFPIFALDRIWIRPKDALLRLAVHDTPLARIASDHLPLIAEVRIP